MKAIVFGLLTALTLSTTAAAEDKGVGVLKIKSSGSSEEIDYWILVDAKTEQRLAKFYGSAPTLLPVGTFRILLRRNNTSAEIAVPDRISIKQNSQTILQVSYPLE